MSGENSIMNYLVQLPKSKLKNLQNRLFFNSLVDFKPASSLSASTFLTAPLSVGDKSFPSSAIFGCLPHVKEKKMVLSKPQLL